MKYDPELAALLSQPWNNSACRSYVIYAMENCDFLPEDIRRVWKSSIMFSICTAWKRPRGTIRIVPINFETFCPEAEQGKEAASFMRTVSLLVLQGHEER